MLIVVCLLYSENLKCYSGVSFYIPLYYLSNHNNYPGDVQGKKDFAAEV